MKDIDHVSKKGVTISGTQRCFEKNSTTTYEETSLGENLFDPNGTASDKGITINSIGHHLSDSITSAENLNDKSCDCKTKVNSWKDEFNLK